MAATFVASTGFRLKTAGSLRDRSRADQVAGTAGSVVPQNAKRNVNFISKGIFTLPFRKPIVAIDLRVLFGLLSVNFFRNGLEALEQSH